MQFSQNRGKFKVGLRDSVAVPSQILKYIQITWGLITIQILIQGFGVEPEILHL